MRLWQKVEWRVRLLARAAYLWREVDWRDVLKEMFSSHSSKPYPPPPLLDQNDVLGLYKVGHHRVFFPLGFDPSFLTFVYEEIFVHRVYEYGKCQIKPGDWVVDARACEGLFTLYALQKGANVLAFEPVPELAQALQRTLAEFIKTGRVIIFPFALGRQQEEKVLHVYRQNVAGSTMSSDVLAARGGSANEVQEVQISVTTLDLLWAEGLLPNISFIKADVEGSERDLLLGAREVIRQFRPQLSIYTYHRPDDWRVIPEIIAHLCDFENGKYRIKLSGLLDHLYGWYKGKT